MDVHSLKTASQYVNNLLLARGLLRNGTPIEFARPSRGEGGAEATMAAIINLVHDMVLRRDREQEQKETLVNTLRTLRTESTRKDTTIERLQLKCDDLARQLSQAQTQERTARTAQRTAESSSRALREEVARLKTTVQQVRTQCMNDVRKRDVQIQRLKSHLTAQQRGNKTSLVGPSITITPGNSGSHAGSVRDDESPNGDDHMQSLRQETTEFLTQLSQSLSDENDNLIALVRNTLYTLKEVQGLPEGEALGRGASQQEEVDGEGTSMVNAPHTSYDALAADMDAVLDNLRNLLTNPNFVPIDEVEAREEEIIRLREGWEKMEAKWREAVLMMESWRKRMLNGGDTVNLEELRKGLRLGQGVETVHGTTDMSMLSDDENDADEGDETVNEDDQMDEDTVCDDTEQPDLPSPEKSTFEHIQSAKTSNSDLFNLKLPRPDSKQQHVLQETTGNLKSPRKVTFAPSRDNTPAQVTDENSSTMDLPKPTPTPSSRGRSQGVADSSRIPKSRKRQSSTPAHSQERSPKMSVEEKLKQVKAEAEAAAVAAGLTTSSNSTTRSRGEGKEEMEEVLAKRRGSPKKTNVRGRPRRRKSTLTEEELNQLMGFE